MAESEGVELVGVGVDREGVETVEVEREGEGVDREGVETVEVEREEEGVDREAFGSFFLIRALISLILL
jgi:hypothetical protein